MEGKTMIAVVVACFKVDLQCKHLLGQTQKNYKNTQSKLLFSVPWFPKRNVPGMKQECQPLLNLMEIRYEYGRWVGSKIWRLMPVLFILRFYYKTVTVVQDRDSIWSKVKQEYKLPALTCSEQKLRFTDPYLWRYNTVSATTYSTPFHQTYSPPPLTWKKQKNHNLAQRKHNISARSLLPLINYLEHYVILRCPCLEPNAS